MIRKILISAALAALAVAGVAEERPASALEREVAEATQSKQVTVVHFWAPWCPNCKAELSNGGWSGFIAANPDVNFVFVTIWNAEDGREVLEKYGVGGEKNFRLLLHPNSSRKRGEKVDQLLGVPISWIPTTWIYRDGGLRYAMNFGELRFPILQQLVNDSRESWDR